jgi:hypothetical protein
VAARHDFKLGAYIDEGIEDRWHRVHAKCQRCGEERKVWNQVPMDRLNAGTCLRMPKRRSGNVKGLKVTTVLLVILLFMATADWISGDPYAEAGMLASGFGLLVCSVMLWLERWERRRFERWSHGRRRNH